MSTRAATKRRADAEAPRLPLSRKTVKHTVPDSGIVPRGHHLPQLPPALPASFSGLLGSKPDTLTLNNICEKKDWDDVPERLILQLARNQQLPSRLDIDYSYHVRVAAIRIPFSVIHALQPLTSLTRIEFSGGFCASTTADPFDKLPLGSPSCSLTSLKVAHFDSGPLKIAVASLATFAPNLEQLSCHSLTVEGGRDIKGYGARLPRLTHLSAATVQVQHVHSAEEAGRTFAAAVPSLRVLPKIPSVVGNTGYFVYERYFVPFCRPDFHAYDFLRYCTALVAIHRDGSRRLSACSIWDPEYAAWVAPIAEAAAVFCTPQRKAAAAAEAARAAASGRVNPQMLYKVPNLGLVSMEELEATATRVPPPGLSVLRGLTHLRCLKISGLREPDLPFLQEVSQLQQLKGFECSLASSSVAGQMEGLLEALVHLPQLLALGLPGELLCRGGCLRPTGRGRDRVQELLLELVTKPCMRKMVFLEPRRAEDARYVESGVVYCSHNCWNKGLQDLQRAAAAAAIARAAPVVGAQAEAQVAAGTTAANAVPVAGGAVSPSENHKRLRQHQTQKQREEDMEKVKLEHDVVHGAVHSCEPHVQFSKVADIVLLARGSGDAPVGSSAPAAQRKPHPVWGEFEPNT